jgi:hypothetical protein
MATDKQAWLNRAYAECRARGHHDAKNVKYHNGACQEGFEATANVVHVPPKEPGVVVELPGLPSVVAT